MKAPLAAWPSPPKSYARFPVAVSAVEAGLEPVTSAPVEMESAASLTFAVPLFAIGVSLTSVTDTVTVASSERVGVPSSVARTVSVKVWLASKSTAPGSTTVIAPVAGSMANAPPVLPASSAYVCTSPVSMSVAATVPTSESSAGFSAMVKLASSSCGASLTPATAMVTVAESVKPPGSRTV